MEDEEAGSLSEPDVSASSLGVSSFLPSLTERQFRVMQGGMSVELTKDEMTHMIRNVVKIVSTISLNIIVPKLEEVFNLDPRSSFLSSPGSSKKVETSIPGQTLGNTSPHAKISVDGLLSETESEVSEEDHSEFRISSPNAAWTAEMLVNHTLAYIQEDSDVHFEDAVPAVPLDSRKPTCLQSFQEIQSEDNQTKSAQNVSEVLMKSSESFTLNSLHSLRAHLVPPEHCVPLPGTPTPSETSKGEDKKPHLLRSSVRIPDKNEGTKSREMVSISTLVDAVLTSLGLQGSGHSISLKDLSAVTERVDDLFSTTATQELTDMVQLILMDTLSSLNISNPDLHQYIAVEFLSKFADESVRRLLMSCIAPRPASASTEDIPSLVMPFEVSPESFEVSRPPSEVFADTIDLFAKGMVKNIMDNVSAVPDHEEDTVVSKAEATPDIDSHSSEELNPVQPGSSASVSSQNTEDILLESQDLLKSGREDYETLLVLRLLVQMSSSSSYLRKRLSSKDPDELIKRILPDFSTSSNLVQLDGVLRETLSELRKSFGEGGSLYKILNPQDATFDWFLMTVLQEHLDLHAPIAVPETVKNEKPKKRKSIFHLKMPKINIFKKRSNKDNSAGSSDQDPLRSCCTADMGGSNTATPKKKKTWRNIFTRMFSFLRNQAATDPVSASTSASSPSSSS